jgi:hypothetical protein
MAASSSVVGVGFLFPGFSVRASSFDPSAVPASSDIPRKRSLRIGVA